MTLRQRPGDHGDIVAALRRECGLGRLCQRGIAFQSNDGFCQPGQECCAIAGAAADIEYLIAGVDLGQLHKLGQRRRLHEVEGYSAVC